MAAGRSSQLWFGLIGGLSGSFLMRVALTKWYPAILPESQHGAFGLDREADLNSIQLLAKCFTGRSLPEEQALSIAAQFHYVYGAMGGFAYAVAGQRFPLLRLGYGTGFGALIWLFGDELPISALGISDPRKKSTYSHLAALIGHLMYGATLEFFLRQSGPTGKRTEAERQN